jgi:NADH-quinone oxidoreductase subunit D
MINDMGAWQTALLWGMREREKILDLFEMVSGTRMMCNYFRFGGVIRDIDAEWIDYFKDLLVGLPSFFDDFERLLSDNEVMLIRSRGVGVLPKELAVAYSVTGPVLRGSGIPYDVRRAEPYGIYDRFNFDIPIGSVGDVYDRYLVRIEEMRQSYRILQQALEQLPDASGGHINTKVKQQSLKPPVGDAYARVEGPKGELGYYLVSDGSGNPYRYAIRAPSFINLSALSDMCRGHKVADVVVILGSIDIVMGEVDR